MEREVDSGHRRNKTKEWREVKWTPRNNNKDGEKKVQTMDTVETKRRGKEREVDREPKKDAEEEGKWKVSQLEGFDEGMGSGHWTVRLGKDLEKGRGWTVRCQTNLENKNSGKQEKVETQKENEVDKRK
jgi:hypothetical protein